jgi:hypothetical protein
MLAASVLAMMIPSYFLSDQTRMVSLVLDRSKSELTASRLKSYFLDMSVMICTPRATVGPCRLIPTTPSLAPLSAAKSASVKPVSAAVEVVAAAADPPSERPPLVLHAASARPAPAAPAAPRMDRRENGLAV